MKIKSVHLHPVKNLADAKGIRFHMVPETYFKSAKGDKKSRKWQNLNDQKLFEGKKNQSFTLCPENPGDAEVLFGLGDTPKLKLSDYFHCGGTLTRKIKALKGNKASVLWNESGMTLSREALETFILGLYLGSYSFTHKKPSSDADISLHIYADHSGEIDLKAIEKKYEAIKLTRDIVNANASEATPEGLASAARAMCRKFSKIKLTVLNEKQIKKEKMGLLHAVGQGADFPPRLVIMEYRGASSKDAPLAIVGKGITFDTGGLNLKPTGHMEDMRMDMAGAGAVLGAMQGIASLGLKVNVIGVMACAENAIGPASYKPGDVFTAYNGKTVEVLNTDAEGRLALADALAYTEKHFKPRAMVDLATLTGACLVALGHQYAALLTESDQLRDLVCEASLKTSDPVWELPLTEVFFDEMKSDIADLKNTGKTRYAGTIQGAVFLKNFVEHCDFAHLDIAGVAWSPEAKGATPKYATGFGVHLLIELARAFGKKH